MTGRRQRRGITRRELLIVVTVILAVAAGMHPVARWAWRKRQERLGRDLGAALRQGELDSARRLLARGADPNAVLTSPSDPVGTSMMYCAAYGRPIDGLAPGGAVDLLLAYGGDINARDRGGVAILHPKATHGKTDVEFLLSRGADPNATNSAGHTPLHWATMYGNEDAVRLLLDAGARPDLADQKGRTAVHWAVNDGEWQILKLLLAEGADPNARDGRGRAPLHMAARIGSAGMAQALLDHGADASLTDGTGETALQIAEQQGHVDVIKVLREHTRTE